ncbi:MAG: hypothetical protein JWM95_2041 [Gemmatimonadetes bacterium]|nr:hypothetical protein [Gemmatimonadota bacterium]
MTSALRAAATIALVAGCARNAPGDSPGELARDPRVISAAELSAPAVVGLSTYEAIRALRPQFFVDNVAGAGSKEGRRLEISVNGGRLRPPQDLVTIPASNVAEVRYFASGESVSRFGMRSNLGPVLLVTLVKAEPASPL